LEEVLKLTKLSIIVPFYNEEKGLNLFYNRTIKVLESIDYDYELIYVDNCSQDNSVLLVLDQIKENSKIKYIKMSRNFGPSVEASISAGLENCSGAAAIILYSDLQDPPEVMVQFIKEWEQGFDVVYGRQIKRKGDPVWRNFLVRSYYRIFAFLSDVDLPSNSGDFRLVNRKVIDALNSIPEKARYFRGLSSWVGFKSLAVDYEREPRLSGKSTANLFAITRTAFTAITSFSVKPLRIITFFGFGSLITSVIFTGILFVNWLFDNSIPGLTSITVLILITSAINLLSLGILGEYVSRIQTEVKNRPIYLIDSKINF
jgi:glycosyltransferase involved in cell wall biosynthesis